MKLPNVTILAAATVAAGCAVSHEGEYGPGCSAYAGSTITLSEETFVWDRFTDQIEISDDGKAIDPYPDYPKRGTYRIDGNRVDLTSESGTDTFYLHQQNGVWLLLTADENAIHESSGRYPDCPLTRDSG